MVDSRVGVPCSICWFGIGGVSSFEGIQFNVRLYQISTPLNTKLQF